MDVLKDIHDFTLAEFASERPALSVDENLLEQSIIDSMGFLKLVAFLEEQFGIRVVDDDLVPENFSTLTAIRTFVERKMSSQH